MTGVYENLLPLDFIVVAVYLVLLILLGYWFSHMHRSKSSEQLFLAGRSLKWPSIGLTMWGTNVGPSMLIASASIGYTSGIVAGNFGWYAFVFIFLLAVFFAPRYLGAGVQTLPEFMGRRFGDSTRTILAWYSIVTILVSWLALTLYAGGILVAQVLNLPLWVAVILLLVAGILLLCIPFELKAVRWSFRTFLTPLVQNNKQRKRLYIASALLLWVLCGLFIPSALIASSPVEFAFTGLVENPLVYIVKSAVVFLGIAIVWPLAIYAMASATAKTFLAVGLTLFSVVSLINATFFQGDYGVLSNFLVFDDPSTLVASMFMTIMPFMVTVLLLLCMLLLVRKSRTKWISDLVLILVLASFALSLYNIWTINREFQDHKVNVLENEAAFTLGDEEPIYHLSKEGKNVIVFFLDRAVGAYFPYVLDDIPALHEQFQGFTYYPNTVSYATDTLIGAPALMGGYEYTPEEINNRSDQTLLEKHNESLLIMPRLFYEAGYEVTLSDPPWSNYKWSGDYTPFTVYPKMDVFSIEGKYTNRYLREHFSDLSEGDVSSQIKTNLPRFSLFRIAFPVLRTRMYDQGRYFSTIENENTLHSFLDMYSSLYYLPELTDYEGEGNTFTFIDNETPHRQVDLEVPSFEPKKDVPLVSAPIGNEQQLSRYDIQNYQVNAASLKRIGIWLEKLQGDGVYDNTRIIIVADHGAWTFNPLFAEFEKNRGIYGAYNPLLMVKEFNAVGPIQTDTAFMTNADTSLFAIDALDVSPINPYTGNDLFEQVKKDVVNIYYGGWAPRHHDSHTFILDNEQRFAVKDDITIEENWSVLKPDRP